MKNVFTEPRVFGQVLPSLAVLAAWGPARNLRKPIKNNPNFGPALGSFSFISFPIFCLFEDVLGVGLEGNPRREQEQPQPPQARGLLQPWLRASTLGISPCQEKLILFSFFPFSPPFPTSSPSFFLFFPPFLLYFLLFSFVFFFPIFLFPLFQCFLFCLLLYFLSFFLLLKYFPFPVSFFPWLLLFSSFSFLNLFSSLFCFVFLSFFFLFFPLKKKVEYLIFFPFSPLSPIFSLFCPFNFFFFFGFSSSPYFFFLTSTFSFTILPFPPLCSPFSLLIFGSPALSKQQTQHFPSQTLTSPSMPPARQNLAK